MLQRLTTTLLVFLLASALSSGGIAWARGSSQNTNLTMRITPVLAQSSVSTEQDSHPYAPQAFEWELVPGPTTSRINDVVMLSAVNGWAVGANGLILHWTGSSWQDFPSPTGRALNAIDMLNENQGWAVGNGGEIIRWDGNSWQIVITGIKDVDLYAVGMVSPTDGWAAGTYGNVYHWDGSSWTGPTNPTHRWLNDIAMLSETDGWIVGNAGTILHWAGNAWLNIDSPTTNDLTGLSVVAPDDIWAAAGPGFLHWDGSQWQKVPTTFGGMNVVSMTSASDGWAAGDKGLLAHWDGNSWLQASSPVTYTLNAIDMLYGSNGWAVGFNGTLLHYADQSPRLSSNYHDGKPGSFFTLSGVRFPASSQASVYVNGYSLGKVAADADGELTFLLDTQGAGEGRYIVTASVGNEPVGPASFTLDPLALLRPQEGEGPVFKVPPGIAYGYAVFIPLTAR